MLRELPLQFGFPGWSLSSNTRSNAGHHAAHGDWCPFQPVHWESNSVRTQTGEPQTKALQWVDREVLGFSGLVWASERDLVV